MGTGFAQNLMSLRGSSYQKLILMTDADTGAHIRTPANLGFTCHMKPILEAGYVYTVWTTDL